MLTIYIKGRDEAEMMTIDEMKQLLQASLPPKRYKHSVHVYETALELAKSHKLPEEKIAICALLHDCGREVASKESAAEADALGIALDDVERNQPILLHAKLGVYYAQTKYGVTDKEILAGISRMVAGLLFLTAVLASTEELLAIGIVKSKRVPKSVALAKFFGLSWPEITSATLSEPCKATPRASASSTRS